MGPGPRGLGDASDSPVASCELGQGPHLDTLSDSLVVKPAPFSRRACARVFGSLGSPKPRPAIP